MYTFCMAKVCTQREMNVGQSGVLELSDSAKWTAASTRRGEKPEKRGGKKIGFPNSALIGINLKVVGCFVLGKKKIGSYNDFIWTFPLVHYGEKKN